MSIGTNLKLYRKRSELRQEQVASALGIDRSTYSYYETDKCRPGIDTLIKLSTLFGVELYTLIDYRADSQIPEEGTSVHSGGFDSVPFNRLSVEERDFLLIYRQLSDKGKEYINKRTKLLLDKERIEAENNL